MAMWVELLSGNDRGKEKVLQNADLHALWVCKEGRWEGGGKTSGILALV